MVGQRSDKDSYRIYAFDRIKNVSILDTKSDFPEFFLTEDYFRNSFGIIVDEDYSAEIIWIKAFGIKANYLITLPLHHSQKEIETTTNYVIFEYKLCSTFDFKQELFSHLAEIKVLSPESFRESVKENIQQLLERYV